MNQKGLIVIAGPTAVGKTALSIQLAQAYNADIFSADSRQLYAELNIGVARPSKEELAMVKHHFIGSHSIEDGLNAGSYAEEVLKSLHSYYEKRDKAILCGGTGLYIKAVCQGLDQLPAANKLLRAELQSQLEKEGIEHLQNRLKASSPNAEVEVQNPQRLIRAIEIAESNESKNSGPRLERKFKPLYFYLDLPRNELYQRIDERVEKMMRDGLLNEVRSLRSKQSLNALQTVGYTELFKHLDQEWSLEHAVDKIKQHSRNYAKRQITWFKNQGYRAIDMRVQDPLAELKSLIDAD